MRSASGCRHSGLSLLPILVGYLIVIIVLGCFLDSVSIMLIVLPFVIPVFEGFGVNLIWFGLISVIAIEIGLLTPPLGHRRVRGEGQPRRPADHAPGRFSRARGR